jgi:hypothetical protein
MVEAAGKGGKQAQAIKTTAAFPQMDGAAQSWMFKEVQLLEGVGAIGTQGTWRNWTGGSGGNFRWQADLNHVARFAALDQTQEAAGNEAAHSPAHSVGAETGTASEPGNGEPELKLSLEAAVTEEMRINDTIGSG